MAVRKKDAKASEIPETSSASRAVGGKDLSKSSYQRGRKHYKTPDASESSFAIGQGKAERVVPEV